MSTLILVIALLALAPESRQGTVEVQVDAWQQAQLKHCSLQRNAPFVEDALAALQSSTYEAAPQLAAQFRRRTDAMVRARVVFAAPESVRMKFSTLGPATWQTVAMDELVFAGTQGAAPDYILVRAGAAVRAFAKFTPAAMRSVLRAIADGHICQLHSRRP